MIVKDRRLQRLALAGGLLGGLAVLGLWRMGLGLEDLKKGWGAAEQVLRSHPWWLFLGLVVLPGLPVPTSAMLLLAGAVWGERPVLACAISLAGMALNMAWTYWAAAKPGRGLVEGFLTSSSIRLPDVPRDNHLRMILLLRLTPGIPFFLQNYLLGFFRVPFRLYLPLSVLCNGLFVCGFVLSGAGIGGGNLKPLMSGVGLIVVAVVAVQMMRKRLR